MRRYHKVIDREYNYKLFGAMIVTASQVKRDQVMAAIPANRKPSTQSSQESKNTIQINTKQPYSNKSIKLANDIKAKLKARDPLSSKLFRQKMREEGKRDNEPYFEFD